ncbi:hypothetical protein D9611_001231 [Ephemerocybe angulata]|uniref:Uncharacterized protein n=1 Tax=Ephemerocybe angulata TaxID=980116 RepID=A0A8H5FMT8_9AGAR|nr:hypothetical protein D9611_001231 [Tulosesus angulatus]
MAPVRDYFCDCERMCKGITRQVSRTVFYAHRQKQQRTVTRAQEQRQHPVFESAGEPLALLESGAGNSLGEGREAEMGASSGSSGSPERQLSEEPVVPEPGPGVVDPSNAIQFSPPAIEPDPPAEPEPTFHPSGTGTNPARYSDSLPESLTCAAVPELETALKFRRALEAASLENGDLSTEQVERLRSPTEFVETLDPDTKHALKLYLSTHGASEQVYRDVRLDILDDDSSRDIPSYEGAKKKVAELTGITPIIHHMCPDSCMAYTGPYKDLEECVYCKKPRYDPKTGKPLQYFYTMPLGPQIQARWKDPACAKLMQHRQQETKKIFERLQDPESGGQIDEYSDIYHGQDYLEAVQRGDIGPDDTLLMFSMDGAQLYHDKKSDCWIFIWVILDMAPDQRYKKKHIIPGGVIPGPNNPEHMESFLFPAYHHLAALQKEGLPIFNGLTRTLSNTNIFLFLGSADGPGSVYFTGFVGHHGYFFCRLYCGIPGRHKPERPHYYGALLKPDNYNLDGCSHGDIDAASIGGPNEEKYLENLRYLLSSTGKTNC